MGYTGEPPKLSDFDSCASSVAVACAFFTDTAGRVLIVKPHYRDDWLFVGGFVDRDESPQEACAREVKEELGLDVAVGPLLLKHCTHFDIRP